MPDVTSDVSALPSRRRQTTLALLALGIGLCSLALALPRLATEAVLFRQDALQDIDKYYFSANALALPAHDSATATKLIRQLPAAEPATARRLLAEIRTALEAALSKAPGRARDWGLLAKLGETGTVPPSEAAAAYRMAVITENFSPHLTPWLFELGLRLWPILDERQRLAVRDITMRQWAWQPVKLSETAVHNHARLLVADLMSGSPDIQKEFLRQYDFLEDLWQRQPPPPR